MNNKQPQHEEEEWAWFWWNTFLLHMKWKIPQLDLLLGTTQEKREEFLTFQHNFLKFTEYVLRFLQNPTVDRLNVITDHLFLIQGPFGRYGLWEIALEETLIRIMLHAFYSSLVKTELEQIISIFAGLSSQS